MADKKTPNLAAENAALKARLEALELRFGIFSDTAPREEKDQAMRDWAALPTQQKNQREADRLFGNNGGSLYEVSMELIAPIRIRAHSELEARALFMSLCGVTGIQPPASQPAVRPVGDDVGENDTPDLPQDDETEESLVSLAGAR